MMNWVISSSVLILIVITIRHFLKGKMSLRLQYALWLIVAVRLVFPFSIGEATASVSTWLNGVEDRPVVQEMKDYVQTPIQNMTYEEAFESVAKDYLEQGVDIETLPEDVRSKTIELEVQEKMQSSYTPEEIAKFLWVAGMLLMGACFVVSNLHFSLKLRKDRVFIETYGNRRVYRTSAVETPCLYGFFTPAIYITDEAVEDEARKQHVLEHEMTHYRHGDYIWSLLRVVCLVLHWYNPLVWCAAFLSRRDAELACDEATIQRLGEEERAAYGRTLIGLTCEKRSALLITATTMTGSKSNIKERITLITKKPKMAIFTLVVVVLVAVTAVGCTFTGAKATHDSFSEWAKTITPDNIKDLYVAEGVGEEENRFYSSQDEFGEFIELLQAIPEEDCYRREQYADIYKNYRLGFEFGEKTITLTCLEDYTLQYVGESSLAPEGKTLIIDSPELWAYIVALLEGEGEIPGDEMVQKETYEQCVYETTADLNHDGFADLVKVMTKAEDGKALADIWYNGAYVKVFLGKADKTYDTEPAYTSSHVAGSHSANGTLVLAEKDGKDYLVYSLMYEMQGWAEYRYSIMCLKESGITVVKSDEVSFCFEPFYKQYWEVGNRREDVIPNFKAGLEPWVEDAIILASFDAGTEDYISTSGKEIPASTYYDLVWARNDDERLAEYEKEVGTGQ